MLFRFSDLGFSLAQDEEGDRRWMAVIGCGAQSLNDAAHGNTQQRFVRHEPIDYVYGLKTSNDIRALRQELQDMLARLEPLLETAVEMETAAAGGNAGGGGENGE
jgi:hypothetical protein